MTERKQGHSPIVVAKGETLGEAIARAQYTAVPIWKWYSIESAPRMKTILLFAITDRGDNGEVKNWKMATGFWSDGHSEWIWEGRVIDVWEVQPTHWMELPGAPV